MITTLLILITAALPATLVEAQQPATHQTAPASVNLTDRRLAALSQIETNDRDNPPGADISRYGISRQVWMVYAKGIPMSHATNAATSKRVAGRILTDRITTFKRVFHVEPTEAQVYIMWHKPATISRPSRVTKEIATRFANLVAATP